MAFDFHENGHVSKTPFHVKDFGAAFSLKLRQLLTKANILIYTEMLILQFTTLLFRTTFCMELEYENFGFLLLNCLQCNTIELEPP